MKNIAVITGASSGMGKEFLIQLDGKFDEVWAIGLNIDNLSDLKDKLKTPIIYLELDLTKDESFNIYSNLLKENNVNVSWLINCAGFGKFGRFDEIDVESSANMIDLNCKALLKMTEITIPFMARGGKIIEIGSVAGFQPVPYITTYSATKAFVISYSRALNIELKNLGIHITCVCPFWTKTAFFDRALKTKSKQEVVSKYIALYEPKNVVKKAIKDTIKNKEISICGFIARSQVRLVNILPKRFVMNFWIRQQKLNKKYKNN